MSILDIKMYWIKFAHFSVLKGLQPLRDMLGYPSPLIQLIHYLALFDIETRARLTCVNMSSTKDVILDCARDQYLTVGYKGVSMRKIADKAGISATAIYNHFSNKEELFHRLVKKGFGMYTQYLMPALEEPSAELRFKKTMEYALDFILEQPKYFELIFVKSETKDELVNFKDLRSDSKISFDFYTARIQDCIDEGYLKDDNPSEISVLLLASYTGFFSLYTSGLLPRSKKDIKALYWRTIDRLLKGIEA